MNFREDHLLIIKCVTLLFGIDMNNLYYCTNQ